MLDEDGRLPTPPLPSRHPVRENYSTSKRLSSNTLLTRPRVHQAVAELSHYLLYVPNLSPRQLPNNPDDGRSTDITVSERVNCENTNTITIVFSSSRRVKGREAQSNGQPTRKNNRCDATHRRNFPPFISIKRKL